MSGILVGLQHEAVVNPLETLPLLSLAAICWVLYLGWRFCDGLAYLTAGRSLRDIFAETKVIPCPVRDLVPVTEEPPGDGWQFGRMLVVASGTLVGIAALLLAGGVMALMFLYLGLVGETEEDVKRRLSRHEVFTTLLPPDATTIGDFECAPADIWDGASCRVVYATDLSLDEVIAHYRTSFQGMRGQGSWSSPPQGAKWNGGWGDERYAMSVRTWDPSDWHGPSGPEGTRLLVQLTLNERANPRTPVQRGGD